MKSVYLLMLYIQQLKEYRSGSLFERSDIFQHSVLSNKKYLIRLQSLVHKIFQRQISPLSLTINQTLPTSISFSESDILLINAIFNVDCSFALIHSKAIERDKGQCALDTLKKNFLELGQINFILNNTQLLWLVLHLYPDKDWIYLNRNELNMPTINYKANEIGSSSSNYSEFKVFFFMDSSQTTTKKELIKKDIRSMYGLGTATMHTSDSYGHTLLFMTYLLSLCTSTQDLNGIENINPCDIITSLEKESTVRRSNLPIISLIKESVCNNCKTYPYFSLSNSCSFNMAVKKYALSGESSITGDE